VTFPGWKVAGMVVTELSDDFLRASFAEGSGLGVKDGTIELPKVPLNRSAHYKVLAALDRSDIHTGPAGQYSDPVVVGGIKGGVGGGRIQETRSRTGTPKRAIGLIAFLVVLVVAQLFVFLLGNWKEIGGRDVPVRLVSRNPGSGTRATFQKRLLNGVREPGTDSDDCLTRDRGELPALPHEPGRRGHPPVARRPALRRARESRSVSPVIGGVTGISLITP
jgi:hypothetical protein